MSQFSIAKVLGCAAGAFCRLGGGALNALFACARAQGGASVLPGSLYSFTVFSCGPEVTGVYASRCGIAKVHGRAAVSVSTMPCSHVRACAVRPLRLMNRGFCRVSTGYVGLWSRFVCYFCGLCARACRCGVCVCVLEGLAMTGRAHLSASNHGGSVARCAILCGASVRPRANLPGRAPASFDHSRLPPRFPPATLVPWRHTSRDQLCAAVFDSFTNANSK